MITPSGNKDCGIDMSFVFAIRDMNYEKHIRVVSPRSYPLFEGKRKIIIFPGGKTQSLEIGNGMCKATEREFFPELYSDENSENMPSKQRLQIKKAKYQAQKLRDDFEIGVIVYNGRNFVLQAYEFFNHCIVPAVAKIDKNACLQRLDFDEAVFNMRHFVFNTHCYGGFIIKAIDRDLKKLLPQIGYTPKESSVIARQCVVFDHNNIDEALGYTDLSCSYIRRMNLQDNVLEYKSCNNGSYQQFIKGVNYPFDKPSLDVLSEHEAVLLTPTLCKNEADAHNGYWNLQDSLTENGIEERMIFSALAREVISTKAPITDIKHLILNTLNGKTSYRELLNESIDNGKQHMQSFAHYRQQMMIDTDYRCSY